jgi:sporulation protein YlmC with PRC-barrel domain
VLLLLPADIRQLNANGVVIDSIHEFIEPTDAIRLHDALAISYTPLHQRVISDTGRRLGFVRDFTINVETLRLQKLAVKPTRLLPTPKPPLLIDRTQIIDITPQAITVRDSLESANAIGANPVPGS